MTWQQIAGVVILIALNYLVMAQGQKIGRQTAIIGVLDALQEELGARKKSDTLTKDQMQLALSLFERIKEL